LTNADDYDIMALSQDETRTRKQKNMKTQDLGSNKTLAVGTVVITESRYPFRTVMVVSAEEFAEFGLEDRENYNAKRLVKDDSTKSYISRHWEYVK
jgi:hypothetical protein